MLGLVEGLADFSAASLNYLSGWLSDRSGKRKAFTLAGYVFSTLAKTLLLFSSSLAGLAIFRIIERLGKGFRGPPRDAWLAAVADRDTRGYSFGVHKALDKSGAIIGPLVAYGLLAWLGDEPSTFRTLFWVTLVPAVISIVVLGCVRDRPGLAHRRENMVETWKTLSPGFKRYLVYLLMSLGFAFATAKWQVIILFVVYGLFYAIDEAQSKAFIADIETERRASAIGVYNFVTGLIYPPASLIAGVLWLIHPFSAFIVAATIAFTATGAFVILRPDLERSSEAFPGH